MREPTGVRGVLDAQTWREHAGRWIAVALGEIIAAGDTYYRTLAELRGSGVADPEDCDFVAWVPEDDRVPFDRWLDRAQSSGREFRRRLRG